MEKIAALYLAHLNPFTKAHQEIITNLQKNYIVYVFPVRFIKNGKEINTRSFPFTYDIRKSMIRSVFPNEEKVIVSPNYTFFSPFLKYLPPIFSPYSWKIRDQVLKSINEKNFISYTGDRIERYALKIYRFNPIKATRLSISASQVKEIIYDQALNKRRENIKDSTWEEKIPSSVVKIIKDNWNIIEKFANEKDETLKVVGVKFPKKGFF
ncbi:MAG TPA: hypothetical protein VFM28_07980 [Nitrososphaeraceae archaeon]|jgi:hypothetical protein|nr:hypothetical protein [Nitrososphaeraceae archaeon]